MTQETGAELVLEPEIVQEPEDSTPVCSGPGSEIGDELGSLFLDQTTKPEIIEQAPELVAPKPAQGLKRISFFHKELAKRVASGMKNSEILDEVDISASRLSILKANPLFDNIVQEYRARFDDSYFQAHKTLEAGAVKVAEGLLDIATNPLSAPPSVRASTGFGVLDRIGMTRGPVSGQGPTPGTPSQGGEEIIFEKMLRVVKRQMNGPDETTGSEAGDMRVQEALTQLEQLGPEILDQPTQEETV